MASNELLSNNLSIDSDESLPSDLFKDRLSPPVLVDAPVPVPEAPVVPPMIKYLFVCDAIIYNKIRSAASGYIPVYRAYTVCDKVMSYPAHLKSFPVFEERFAKRCSDRGRWIGDRILATARNADEPGVWKATIQSTTSFPETSYAVMTELTELTFPNFLECVGINPQCRIKIYYRAARPASSAEIFKVSAQPFLL